MPEPSAVRCAEDLRAAAEAFSALRHDDLAAANDPVGILRSLHATLHALHQAWPDVSVVAGFEDPFGDDATEFSDDIERGLRLAEDGLLNAVEASRRDG